MKKIFFFLIMGLLFIIPLNVNASNKLANLSITGYSFDFDSNKNNYSFPINAETIIINATLETPSTASFDGETYPRTVTLEYGKNIINVNVVDSSGTNSYVLTITRADGRSSNNFLYDLRLSSGKLSPTFHKDILTYDVTVPVSVDQVSIMASLSDSRSDFVEGFGERTVTLSTGENRVLIQIKAETGDIRTYTINITRSQISSNNYLKSLTLSSGTMSFSQSTYEYNVNVVYDVSTITIDAVPVDASATVEVVGDKNLVVGENMILVVVTAENNSTRTYTLYITRLEDGNALSSNNSLKSLTIRDYAIPFDVDTLNYTIRIDKERQLDIEAIAEHENAYVEIMGNKNLRNGSLIRVVITADDGSEKTYTIKVIKPSSVTFIVGILALVLIGLVLLGIIFKDKIFKKKDNNKKKDRKIDENNNKTETYEPIGEILTFEEK